MCPVCRLSTNDCACKQQAAQRVLGDGRVRVARETSGRGGKAVTVVRGLALDAEGLAQLGKALKAACGTGGTVKDGVVEVQGDHVEKVLAWLQARGHAAKRAGG
jgi:translation initiation factor 1